MAAVVAMACSPAPIILVTVDSVSRGYIVKYHLARKSRVKMAAIVPMDPQAICVSARQALKERIARRRRHTVIKLLVITERAAFRLSLTVTAGINASVELVSMDRTVKMILTTALQILVSTVEPASMRSIHFDALARQDSLGLSVKPILMIATVLLVPMVANAAI